MGLWEGEYISTQSRYQTQGERVLNNYWERFLHRNERVNMHVMTLRRLREQHVNSSAVVTFHSLHAARHEHCFHSSDMVTARIIRILDLHSVQGQPHDNHKRPNPQRIGQNLCPMRDLPGNWKGPHEKWKQTSRVAHFSREVNPNLAKPQFKAHGGLAKFS